MKSRLTFFSAVMILISLVLITGTALADADVGQPSTSPACPPNHDPNISLSDTSVFLCSSGDSVKIRLLVTDPDAGNHVKLEKISGTGTFITKNQLAPISTVFSFRPDTNGVYRFIFRATDEYGATDQDTVRVTVTYNLPPQLTCPNTQNHHINGTYTVSQVIANDFDGTISSLNGFLTGTGLANLSLTNIHGIGTDSATADIKYDVVNHCAAGGFVYLIGIDNCGAADTCFFGINLTNTAPAIICPSNDSVLAGATFVSTNFSVTDPDNDVPTVTILSVSPSVTNQPTIVASHVNWVTTCSEKGTYTIRLRATDPCGYKDTCEFTVNVYNQPPVLTCPNNGSVHAGSKFVSSNFSSSDPVTFLDITPPAAHNPYKMGSHIEWQTTCAEKDTYTIRLVATGNCGAKDTCEFKVNVYNQPPVLVCPDNDSINAGDKFYSTDYSVTDPDDPTGVTVNILSVSPTPSYNPTLVGKHVEWRTKCADLVNGPTFTITLVASDPCGAKDTCQFTVTVYNLPPVITCPEDDSVRAKNKFISTDFSASDPKCEDIKVNLCGIDPPPVHQPYIMYHHVEWQTECEDAGKTFTICLEATDSCGAKDTCYFHVKVYNYPPEITCPEDDSVHAGIKFVSTDFSASDPKCEDIKVNLCGIDPPPVHQPIIKFHHVEWQTDCEDAGKTFTICLEATDDCGAKDTCYFHVTVYNEPPILTCPDDDSVRAGVKFISTDFSVTDPEGDSVTVIINSVSPTPTNAPIIVGHHIEWLSCCADLTIGPVFTFTLIATDSCGAADTCQFTVTVYNLPPEITCPEDDSIHAGGNFVSTDFSTDDPKAEPVKANLCGIDPASVNPPTIVQNHVEWQTACGDAGKTFTLCLVAEDSCGAKDTCYFHVTVYNRPPQLTCPNDGIINATQTFVSSDFSVINLDGDLDSVTFLDITPPATNNPTIVGSHVEWVTTIYEYGDYIIRLVATDPCGLKDTCQFKVTVYNEGTSVLDCPKDDSVHTGVYFTSTNFSVTGPGANPDSVRIISITPPPAHPPIKVEYHVEWQTECSDSGKVFTICLESKDDLGLGDYDTCCFYVTVYNRPPQLICPNDDTTAAGGTFISTDFSASDIDGDSVTVTILSVSPSPVHNPTIVENHVEWVTDCDERGDHIIKLVVTDPCGLKDTCQFVVNVVCSPPPELVCPDDGHINAGLNFVSIDYDVITSNGGAAHVSLLDITPTPHGKLPVIIGSHVEWMTHLLDEGDYFIRLLVSDNCGNKDTCQFKVNVYNCHNPNFDITVSPDTQLIIAGQTAGYGVKLTRYFNLDKPCTLTVSGIPHPGNGVFDRARFYPTDSTLLTIYTSALTDTGLHVLTLKAWTLCGPNADYVEHEIPFVLRILKPIDAGDESDNPNTPSGFALYQNQPNPFNPETQINYYLPKSCYVNLNIYNVLGQKVKCLYQGYQSAGMNTIAWDGRGKDGNQLSSGIYFYRLEAGEFVQTKKMSLMK